MLTSAAGYLGLVAGIAVVELVDALLAGAAIPAFKNPDVALASAFLTLAILIAAGVLAGLVPAARAREDQHRRSPSGRLSRRRSPP